MLRPTQEDSIIEIPGVETSRSLGTCVCAHTHTRTNVMPAWSSDEFFRVHLQNLQNLQKTFTKFPTSCYVKAELA